MHVERNQAAFVFRRPKKRVQLAWCGLASLTEHTTGEAQASGAQRETEKERKFRRISRRASAIFSPLSYFTLHLPSAADFPAAGRQLQPRQRQANLCSLCSSHLTENPLELRHIEQNKTFICNKANIVIQFRRVPRTGGGQTGFKLFVDFYFHINILHLSSSGQRRRRAPSTSEQ